MSLTPTRIVAFSQRLPTRSRASVWGESELRVNGEHKYANWGAKGPCFERTSSFALEQVHKRWGGRGFWQT